MKFTHNWLLDHLDTSADLDSILKGLMSLGLEVEETIDYKQLLSEFTVAEIISATKHPNADKLQVCQVQTTEGIKQIVCGAANARAGIKVIYAKVGVYIPGNGIVIKPARIREVESCGMLVSLEELTLESASEGIIELPNTAKVGDLASDALGISDVLIDVAVTPNLGHLLGVRNLAKALAGLGMGKVKAINYEDLFEDYVNKYSTNSVANAATKANKEDRVGDLNHNNLNIELNKQLSLAMAGIIIEQVDNSNTCVLPSKILNRLSLVGLHQLDNPLQNIANYLMLDLNHPLQIYDVGQHNICDIGVNYANKITNLEISNTDITQESLPFSLKSDLPVVVSQNKFLSTAGLGFNQYPVSSNTSKILVTCAHFNRAEIGKASQKSSINNDDSYRFQRGVSPLDIKEVCTQAIFLINRICGGKVVASGCFQHSFEHDTEFTVSVEFINDLLGTKLTLEQMVDYLTQQFGITASAIDNHRIKVLVKFYRGDIVVTADIADVILKHVGVDTLPLQDSELHSKEGLISTDTSKSLFKLANVVKTTLAGVGLVETLNMSFISEELARTFNIYEDSLHLANPISVEYAVMRKSLLASLMQVIAKNSLLGYSDIACFEVANVYQSLTVNSLNVGAVFSGFKERKDWRYKDTYYSFFDVKQLLFNLLESLNINPDKFSLSTVNLPPYFHPGKAATLCMGKKVLACFGEFHPNILKYFKLKKVCLGLELDLASLPLPKNKGPVIKKLSKQMPLQRDFAFILPKAVTAGELIRAVKGSDQNLIHEVRIFDVFEGDVLGSHKKSIAFSVTIIPQDTLNEEAIGILSDKIINSVHQKCGGILRDDTISNVTT